MPYAIKPEGVWIKDSAPIRIGEVVYLGGLAGMSPEQRGEVGAVWYEPAGAAPTGQTVVGSYLTDDNGAPREVNQLEPIPLLMRKGQKLAQLEVAYNAALAVGYPKAFGGVAETLQCRNDHDRTNWLGLIEKCKVVMGQGGGELPIDPPLRCTSNRKYAVTHAEAYVIMLEILNWVAGVMAVNWTYKDDIEAAATNAELDAINVELGWG